MNILALPIGDETTGSSWFRLYQHVPALHRYGWNVSPVVRAIEDASVINNAATADVVINQKNIFPLGFAKKLRNNSRRIIFDLDDAIYTRPGKPYSWLTQRRVDARLRYQLTTADAVTTSSQYLAEHVSPHAKRVFVIPMAIDLEHWTARNVNNREEIVIGWAGAPHNLTYLEQLEPVLRRILAEFPATRIAVFCGKRPNWHLPTDYVPFEKGKEAAFVQGLDIGLLPMREDPFTRGKSPIKALQYMASGVPVVGNVFGATREILTDANSLPVLTEQDWLPAISRLIDDAPLRTDLGNKGRALVEQKHNAQTIQKELVNILDSVTH